MFNLEDYTTVKQRIDLFWSMHPMGRILTTITKENEFYIVCRTELYRDDVDERPFATGHAKEVISERGVNRDFALENCETSSVGVAMKNAKIGTEKNAISREEAEKVNRLKANKFEKRIADKIPVEKPSDPWTIEQKEMPLPVADAVAALNDNVTPEEVPMCKKHDKPMTPRTGNKNGRPWKHYKCAGNWPDACDEIIWMEIDKTGRWVKQKPRMQNGELQ